MWLGIKLGLDGSVVIQEPSLFWLTIDIAGPVLLLGWVIGNIIQLFRGGKHGL